MKKIIETMDEITDAIDQSINSIIEIAKTIIFAIGWLILLLTAPVWLFPYRFIRDFLLPAWKNLQEMKERGKEDGESGN